MDKLESNNFIEYMFKNIKNELKKEAKEEFPCKVNESLEKEKNSKTNENYDELKYEVQKENEVNNKFSYKADESLVKEENSKINENYDELKCEVQKENEVNNEFSYKTDESLEKENNNNLEDETKIEYKFKNLLDNKGKKYLDNNYVTKKEYFEKNINGDFFIKIINELKYFCIDDIPVQLASEINEFTNNNEDLKYIDKDMLIEIITEACLIVKGNNFDFTDNQKEILYKSLEEIIFNKEELDRIISDIRVKKYDSNYKILNNFVKNFSNSSLHLLKFILGLMRLNDKLEKDVLISLEEIFYESILREEFRKVNENDIEYKNNPKFYNKSDDEVYEGKLYLKINDRNLWEKLNNIDLDYYGLNNYEELINCNELNISSKFNIPEYKLYSLIKELVELYNDNILIIGGTTNKIAYNYPKKYTYFVSYFGNKIIDKLYYLSDEYKEISYEKNNKFVNLLFEKEYKSIFELINELELNGRKFDQSEKEYINRINNNLLNNKKKEVYKTIISIKVKNPEVLYKLNLNSLGINNINDFKISEDEIYIDKNISLNGKELNLFAAKVVAFLGKEVIFLGFSYNNENINAIYYLKNEFKYPDITNIKNIICGQKYSDMEELLIALNNNCNEFDFEELKYFMSFGIKFPIISENCKNKLSKINKLIEEELKPILLDDEYVKYNYKNNKIELMINCKILNNIKNLQKIDMNSIKMNNNYIYYGNDNILAYFREDIYQKFILFLELNEIIKDSIEFNKNEKDNKYYIKILFKFENNNSKKNIPILTEEYKNIFNDKIFNLIKNEYENLDQTLILNELKKILKNFTNNFENKETSKEIISEMIIEAIVIFKKNNKLNEEILKKLLYILIENNYNFEEIKNILEKINIKKYDDKYIYISNIVKQFPVYSIYYLKLILVLMCLDSKKEIINDIEILSNLKNIFKDQLFNEFISYLDNKKNEYIEKCKMKLQNLNNNKISLFEKDINDNKTKIYIQVKNKEILKKISNIDIGKYGIEKNLINKMYYEKEKIVLSLYIDKQNLKLLIEEIVECLENNAIIFVNNPTIINDNYYIKNIQYYLGNDIVSKEYKILKENNEIIKNILNKYSDIEEIILFLKLNGNQFNFKEIEYIQKFNVRIPRIIGNNIEQHKRIIVNTLRKFVQNKNDIISENGSCEINAKLNFVVNKYDNSFILLNYIEPGEKVKIVRESNNKYDSSAIIVKNSSEENLGYLSSDLSVKLSNYIDTNVLIVDFARVEKIEEKTLSKKVYLDVVFKYIKD